jgi:hypothetical protein
MGLQHHSVRGRLSTGRSRFAWQIEKSRDDERGTIYSIIEAVPAPKNPRAAKPKAAAKPKTKTNICLMLNVGADEFVGWVEQRKTQSPEIRKSLALYLYQIC